MLAAIARTRGIVAVEYGGAGGPQGPHHPALLGLRRLERAEAAMVLAADGSHDDNIRAEHCGVGCHLARAVDRDLEHGAGLPGADAQELQGEVCIGVPSGRFAYGVTRMETPDRLWHRMGKIARRLGDDVPNPHIPPRKPKWMRTTAYDRLLESWHEAWERRDDIYDAKIAGFLARLERFDR